MDLRGSINCNLETLDTFDKISTSTLRGPWISASGPGTTAKGAGGYCSTFETSWPPNLQDRCPRSSSADLPMQMRRLRSVSMKFRKECPLSMLSLPHSLILTQPFFWPSLGLCTEFPPPLSHLLSWFCIWLGESFGCESYRRQRNCAFSSCVERVLAVHLLWESW